MTHYGFQTQSHIYKSKNYKLGPVHIRGNIIRMVRLEITVTKDDVHKPAE